MISMMSKFELLGFAARTFAEMDAIEHNASKDSSITNTSVSLHKQAAWAAGCFNVLLDDMMVA